MGGQFTAEEYEKLTQGGTVPSAQFSYEVRLSEDRESARHTFRIVIRPQGDFATPEDANMAGLDLVEAFRQLIDENKLFTKPVFLASQKDT